MQDSTGIIGYTHVTVFSATKARERDNLGVTITRWIRNHPNIEIMGRVVTQSSDKEFHCLTITLFYNEK